MWCWFEDEVVTNGDLTNAHALSSNSSICLTFADRV